MACPRRSTAVSSLRSDRSKSLYGFVRKIDHIATQSGVIRGISRGARCSPDRHGLPARPAEQSTAKSPLAARLESHSAASGADAAEGAGGVRTSEQGDRGGLLS